MNTEAQQAVPLLDAMTFILIPFKTESLQNAPLINQNSVWENYNANVDHTAFYPHIQKFLIGNMGLKDGENVNPKNCAVYSLKDKWESVTDNEQSIKQIFNNNQFIINNEELANISFSFENEKNSLASPKLVLYPQSSIGVLLLSIKSGSKTINIDELTSLNYALHKIGTGQAPCIQYDSKGKELHANKKESISKLYSALATYGKKEPKDEGWYMEALLKFLLKEIDGIELFNENRMHLFTYLQVHEKHKNDELMEKFTRIVYCQDKEYQVLPDQEERIYTQTFKNIYVGASVEGSAMMTLVYDDSPVFIKGFLKNSLLTRYLWIYILVYIQRYTLIELTRKLMALDTDAAENCKQNLSSMVSELSMLKINAHFTDISDHTQHNTFYRFCVKQLAVKEYIAETKDKIDGLEVVLKAEIEKKENKRAKILEMLLTFLGVAQVFYASVVFFGFKAKCDCLLALYRSCKQMMDAIIILISVILPIIAIYFLCKYLIQPYISKKKK